MKQKKKQKQKKKKKNKPNAQETTNKFWKQQTWNNKQYVSISCIFLPQKFISKIVFLANICDLAIFKCITWDWLTCSDIYCSYHFEKYVIFFSYL